MEKRSTLYSVSLYLAAGLPLWNRNKLGMAITPWIVLKLEYNENKLDVNQKIPIEKESLTCCVSEHQLHKTEAWGTHEEEHLNEALPEC